MPLYAMPLYAMALFAMALFAMALFAMALSAMPLFAMPLPVNCDGQLASPVCRFPECFSVPDRCVKRKAMQDGWICL